MIIAHPPGTQAARQTKGSSKKRRSRGRSCTGWGGFRDTVEPTGRMKGGCARQLNLCMQTSANKQCSAAGQPATELAPAQEVGRGCYAVPASSLLSQHPTQ